MQKYGCQPLPAEIPECETGRTSTGRTHLECQPPVKRYTKENPAKVMHRERDNYEWVLGALPGGKVTVVRDPFFKIVPLSEKRKVIL